MLHTHTVYIYSIVVFVTVLATDQPVQPINTLSHVTVTQAPPLIG